MEQQKRVVPPEQAQPVTPPAGSLAPIDTTSILARIEGATESKQKPVYWTCNNRFTGKSGLCGCCVQSGSGNMGSGGSPSNPVIVSQRKSDWMVPIKCDVNGVPEGV